jgi:hypothetical protein
MASLRELGFAAPSPAEVGLEVGAYVRDEIGI